MKKSIAVALLSGALILPLLQGCFPMVATGAVAGVAVAVDRRPLVVQTNDERIEWRARSLARQNFGSVSNFIFTSFNHRLLITGEVPDMATKTAIEALVRDIPNVQAVHNELIIGPASSLAARSNDALITSKIKTRSTRLSRQVSPLHVKVVTTAGVAFLMGIVTPLEAESAIDMTRTTSGVRRVVHMFEIIPEDAIREIDKTRLEEHNREAAQRPQ